ncbi:hypothetical protein BD410DRAFT_837373 [Rickenella mellea]|uniref:Crinkler effector protein N-terminal domain-containing protein n=1 Tax=Rickenella mellea TaxID=50990 RepID=A0A4Y7QE29_9AGAM|nr:hypothetical protein BD410DRAFT_837373 [Rickenella mellea]
MRLWFLLKSQKVASYVELKDDLSDPVYVVKDLIREDRPNLHGVDAQDLQLWTLNEYEPLPPSATLAQRVWAKGKLCEIATRIDMDQGFPISNAFVEGPPDGHLHIVVVEPPLSESSRPAVSAGLIGRDDTVSKLYEKLLTHRYIQVRGPPASGKTSLAMLLHEHIIQRELWTRVIFLESWRSRPTVPYLVTWQEWLHRELASQPSVLIVDEAQTSYWDRDFWLHIQALNPSSGLRIITFASFGSAGAIIYDNIAPFYILPAQKVGLIPTDYGDGISVGLNFSKEELQAFTFSVFPSHEFDYLFDLTAGHVGACKAVMRAVAAHETYPKRPSKKLYTSGEFLLNIPIEDLFKSLSRSDLFQKGVPSPEILSQPEISEVFREVLLNGAIISNTPIPVADTLDSSPPSPLVLCYSRGWLHSELARPSTDHSVAYTFPSPLHKRYIEWILDGGLPGWTLTG